jgi:membrane-bound lytic murein transglycosylase F
LFNGCGQKASVEWTAAQQDSIRKDILKRIEKKRAIDKMRLEFESSRMGDAIERYKPIIKKYAKRYGFDWRLIVAQIIQESGFKDQARSRVGASGLMQLMPQTAKELSRELDIEYIMKNPRENITAGIYHFQKQYRLYPDAVNNERLKLALASYNCGAGRIFDSQDICRFYKKPTNIWNQVKPNLALLKKSDWQLHLQVWPAGKPNHGYFYGYNETINYVENIWTSYEIYQIIL